MAQQICNVRAVGVKDARMRFHAVYTAHTSIYYFVLSRTEAAVMSWLRL